jgi:DNA-directed RNA polymerase sigma subunit (sigma70/sigma32)
MRQDVLERYIRIERMRTEETLTLKKIGDRLGISANRVRQILDKLERYRKYNRQQSIERKLP